MIQISNLRSFLIEWNNVFILDKAYRIKHGIAFNSPEHRETCQIDIYLNSLEDKIFQDHIDSVIEKNRKDELYKKGEWFTQSEVLPEDLSKVYDDIDIDKFNLPE